MLSVWAAELDNEAAAAGAGAVLETGLAATVFVRNAEKKCRINWELPVSIGYMGCKAAYLRNLRGVRGCGGTKLRLRISP